MIQAEIDAIKNLRKKVREKAAVARKGNQKFDVTENGEYAGLYFILKKLKGEQSKSDRATGQVSSALSRRLARKKTFSSKIGFRFDGSQMTPDQFVEAWEFVVKTLSIEESLHTLKSQVERDRAMVKEDLKKQEALGLFIGQYR